MPRPSTPRVARRLLAGPTIALGETTPAPGIALVDFRALCGHVTGIAPIDAAAADLKQLLALMGGEERFAEAPRELLRGP